MKNISKSLIAYFVGNVFVIPFIASLFEGNLYIYILMISTLLLTLYLIRINIDAFQDGLRKIMNMCDNIIVLGLVSLIILIVSIVFSYLKYRLGINESSGNVSLISKFYQNQFLIGIYITILAPIMEEIIFKHIAIDNLSFIKNRFIKIVIISLLFAAMHLLPEIMQLNMEVCIDMMNYMIYGMLTSLVYVRYASNIYNVIFIHALCNLTTLILM